MCAADDSSPCSVLPLLAALERKRQQDASQEADKKGKKQVKESKVENPVAKEAKDVRRPARKDGH